MFDNKLLQSKLISWLYVNYIRDFVIQSIVLFIVDKTSRSLIGLSFHKCKYNENLMIVCQNKTLFRFSWMCPFFNSLSVKNSFWNNVCCPSNALQAKDISWCFFMSYSNYWSTCSMTMFVLTDLLKFCSNGPKQNNIEYRFSKNTILQFPTEK